MEVIEPFFEDKKEQKRLKPGTRLTLNTAGQLDKGMQQVEMGAIIQVTYKGSKVMTGGDYEGDYAHTMEVAEVESDDDSEDSEDSSTQSVPLHTSVPRGALRQNQAADRLHSSQSAPAVAIQSHCAPAPHHAQASNAAAPAKE